MHERSFGEMTSLSFLLLIQRLCYLEGVFDNLDVDRRVEMISISHTSMIKDMANPVIAQIASPSIIVIPA